MNSKKTSPSVASLAAQILQNENSSAISKTLAGSVLSQTHSDKQTGKEMESTASAVLKSSKYSEESKTLAASLLSQSNKLR